MARARDAVQMLQSDGMLWWMADALAKLFTGENFGKLVLQIAD